MVGSGILLPLDRWSKSYLAMGCSMLLQSRIAMPKAAQDVHEAAKLVSASRMPVQGPC